MPLRVESYLEDRERDRQREERDRGPSDPWDELRQRLQRKSGESGSIGRAVRDWLG